MVVLTKNSFNNIANNGFYYKYGMWTLLFMYLFSIDAHAQGNTNGLVGYYTFCDCTARDVSGNNLHGTIIGSPQCIRGIRDYGLLLNQNAGNNSCGQRGGQYIQLPPLGAIWADGFTVCAWVRFDNQNYFERIIDFGNNSGEAGGLPIWFGREGNSNNLALESWINLSGGQARGTGRLTANNVITNGNIEYYCATISKDTMRIFVNGTLRAQRIGNPIANVTRTRNYIGHSNWCANDPDFKGFMDEVRIYNRALSEQEIQNLFLITNVNDFTITKACNSLNVDFSVPNVANIDSLTWDFGDAASAVHNSATGQAATHLFSVPGTYPVRVIAYKACLNDTVIKQVSVHKVPDQFLGNDFNICPGSQQRLQVNIPGAIYQWQDGSVNNQLLVDQPGMYWVQATIDGCIYRDTVNLASLQKTSWINTRICGGQIFEGYNTSGIYIDTFPLANGCDSIRTLELLVNAVQVQKLSASICAGAWYVLPWNKQVAATGIYKDTLRYVTGCDSVIREINLSVITPVVQTTNATICSASSYFLPWGLSVNKTGVYRDTIKTSSGCDSILRVVNLLVQAPAVLKSTASICSGGQYLLPWGRAVSTAGIYRDTLYDVSGCDSLLREVSVTVKTAQLTRTTASICTGVTYMLPWNQTVSSTGIYRDTLRYLTGCDSVIREVRLTVVSPAVENNNAGICTGQSYMLPWGVAANSAGTYRDTVRTNTGCDSLIRIVKLTVAANPVTAVSKSNDISCMLGSSKLSATGGISYSWRPAASLSDASIQHPIASPATNTTYYVRVTNAAGCTAEDSVTVLVNAGNADSGYLVPNAFTPNGDGINDCFGVAYWGAVEDFTFSIYSRWGEQLFFTRNNQDCWDGRIKNGLADTGVYIYFIQAKTRCGLVERKGYMTLIH